MKSFHLIILLLCILIEFKTCILKLNSDLNKKNDLQNKNNNKKINANSSEQSKAKTCIHCLPIPKHLRGLGGNPP